MKTKITLVVEGVDFDDEVTLDIVGERLSTYSWSESDDVLTVASISDTDDPVRSAESIAETVSAYLPSATVTRYFDDLVGYSEIALRADVTAEAVRLWATGQRGPGNFPARYATVGVGQRRSPIWVWGRVSEWLDEHYALGDGVKYPTDDEASLIDAMLVRRRATKTTGWWTVVQPKATSSSESAVENQLFLYASLAALSSLDERLQAVRENADGLYRYLWSVYRYDDPEEDRTWARRTASWVTV